MFKRCIKGILRGSIVSVILSIIFLIILSIVMINTDLDEQKYNIVYGLITSASLSLGALYAGKYTKKKGIIIGLSVSIIFSLLMNFFISVTGDVDFLGTEMLKKSMINAVVGVISGVLGVNL